LASTLTCLYGQDVHFSQYFNNPLGLNPAQTGNFSGNWRVAANFRNQWQALDYPYRTISASFDKAFIANNRKFAAGLYVHNDHSGSVSVTENKIGASGSYFVKFKEFDISAGMQLGFVMKKLDPYTLPSDYSSLSYQFESSQGGEKLSYFDVSIGTTVKRKFRGFEPELGIAIAHLNHPKESFVQSGERLPLRFIVDLAIKKAVTQDLYLKPRILYCTMTGAKDMVIGSEAGYQIIGNRLNLREIGFGAFWRSGDAMVLMGGVKFNKLDVSLSYDYNVSTLSAYTSHHGAFELSIIYKDITTFFKIFTIPCERI
jgi:type IX secretion system PorP/SprF family membrane protein